MRKEGEELVLESYDVRKSQLAEAGFGDGGRCHQPECRWPLGAGTHKGTDCPLELSEKAQPC